MKTKQGLIGADAAAELKEREFKMQIDERLEQLKNGGAYR